MTLIPRRPAFVLLTLALAACGDLEGCSLERWDPPIAPDPSPYGPCGAVWVSCRPVARTCCPQGFVCPTSADGVCQDVGNLGMARDGGASVTPRAEP